jgi:hypothetical protein
LCQPCLASSLLLSSLRSLRPLRFYCSALIGPAPGSWHPSVWVASG